MAKAQTFAAHHGVMIAGGWGVSVDMAGWLFGLQTLVYKTMDDPDFVMELLDIISEWNEQRMHVFSNRALSCSSAAMVRECAVLVAQGLSQVLAAPR